MSAKNKAIVEEVNDAMRRGDVEGLLARCTDDFVWTMVGEAPIQGKDAVRKFMAQGPQEPPAFSVDTLIAEGDIVVAKGEMTMANDDGADVDYSYCDVWQVRGDKLATLNAFVIKRASAPKTATAGSSR